MISQDLGEKHLSVAFEGNKHDTEKENLLSDAFGGLALWFPKTAGAINVKVGIKKFSVRNITPNFEKEKNVKTFY